MPRSSSGIHHQRQNSDNFILDANYHGRWFQPSSFAQVRFSFRFSFSFSMKIYKLNCSVCIVYGSNFVMQEFGTRSSSLRKNDDDRLFTSGLLDLHSFDTELLPEVWCLFGFSLIK
jgi:kinesin family protein 2/24